MVHSEIAAAISDFKRYYGVPPNTITVGSGVAHELRRVAKYTALYKPIKVNERGDMTLNNIPVLIDYEHPDKIELSIKMRVK